MNCYWFGPCLTIHARGDYYQSKALERIVREKAALLFGRLLPKQTYSIGKWERADGSRIQVQVMRTPLGERVFARVWTPGIEEVVGTVTYYLESSFVVPSQELSSTFTTTDGHLVRDIREAVFIHNDRSRDWSSWDFHDIGFDARPIGDVLIAMTQPLCLGFDDPKEDLDYYRAYRRWKKTFQHFGDFDISPQHLMQGRGPGTSTGKMVLYQRAKLGRKVEYWISEDNVPDDYVINDWAASHTCTGLLTDTTGEYWKVRINDSTTATFTRLDVPLDLRQLRDSAKNVETRLFVEAFVLGYSSLSDEIYTVAISGVPALQESLSSKWNPVAYSWHFNWSGNAATMVAHRSVASYEVNEGRIDSMETEIWTLAIGVDKSSGGAEPFVTCTTGSRYTWQRIVALQSDLVYIPSLSFGGKIMQPWAVSGNGTIPGYGAPVDVPIYAWYGADEGNRIENTSLYTVLYSRERTALTDEESEDYGLSFKVCGTIVKVGGGYFKTGVTQDISYKIVKGDTVVYELIDSSPGYITNKQVDLTPGEEYSVNSGVSGVSLSFADNSTCTTVNYSVSPNPPDSLVLADRVDAYWQPTVTTDIVTRLAIPPSLSLVIPHDCAEGAAISRYKHVSVTSTHRVQTDKPTPSRKYQQYSNIRGYPSELPLFPNAVTTGLGQADFDTTSTTSTLVDYTMEFAAFGRNPMSETRYTEFVSDTGKTSRPTSGDTRGAPEAFSYAQYDSEDPIKPPFSLFEAFGGELMIRGAEDHFISGFPSAFGSKLTPPVLVGSI